MNLSHREAQDALQAVIDGWAGAELKAALVQHLAECAECQEVAAQLSALDNRLAQSLQSRWPLTLLTEREIIATLEKIPTQVRRHTMITRYARTAAWAALTFALVFTLSWSIKTFIPRPTPAAELTTISTVQQPAATPETPYPLPPEASTTPTSIPLPEDTPTPQPPVPGSVGLFPNIEFQFNVSLPDTPGRVTLYSQKLDEKVTVESARQMAARLGVDGSVYQVTGEGFGDVILDIFDGKSLVKFLNFPTQFIYTADYPNALADNGQELPFTDRAAIAEAFVQERGLLDAPYRVEPLVGQRGGVGFVRLLDGRPVIYGIGRNAGYQEWLNVTVNAAGQVSQVSYSQHDFQPVGEYPILSAQDAWQRLSAEKAYQRLMYAVLSPDEGSTYQSWRRIYQPGQRVDVYGYLSVEQPAEAGGSPVIWLNNFPLSGNVQGLLAQDLLGRFVHIQGIFRQDANGKESLNVESWEISALGDEYLSGKIQRQGNGGHLLVENQVYFLPDLPANLPDGAQVNARGVTLAGTPPTLDWSFIDAGQVPGSYGVHLTCGGGGGGGGGGPENVNFGGGSFALLKMGGLAEPTPSPVPAPFQPGDTVDGLRGTVSVIIQMVKLSMHRRDVNFWVEPSDEMPDGWYGLLRGAVLDNIVLFHNLPVRIWGQALPDENGLPVIDVSRFEPVYPGVQIQQWNGTQEIVNLEGKDVVILTTSTGAQYVMKSSIDREYDTTMGNPGDLVEVEGFVIPDLSYAGYAVIQDLGGGMPPDEVVSNAQPYINYHTQYEEISYDQYLQGKVLIDHVELAELAYTTISLMHCPGGWENDPMLASFLYVQPVWVFKGHFEDGRLFEIQIQALPEEYLQ